MGTVLSAIGGLLDNIFYSFDMSAFEFFGNIQSPALTLAAKIFTFWGDGYVIAAMAVLGVILCFFKKTRRYGAALLIAIAVGTILTNVIMKPLIMRARPYITLAPVESFMQWYENVGGLVESDYSFPSGHTTAAFEIAISMFLCLKDKSKIAYIFPLIAAFTMISRVYLMVHYVSDVLGGKIVGIAAGILGYYVSGIIVKALNKTKLGGFDIASLHKKER